MILSFEKVLGELLIARRGFHGNSARGRVVNDSRKVLPGDIFVAIPGTVSDGHNYIDAAIRARAQVVIHQHPLSHYAPTTTYLMVTNTRLAYARCCREFCGCPDKRLPLFGVTGTNGKTTTVYLIEHLLREGGRSCGLVSTVETRDGKVARPADRTTPEAGVLFPLLAEMRRNRMAAAAMELSSHALDQGRVAGARFRVAIFTNLTGDHLDYHRDMEHYYQAKRRLFTEQLSSKGAAVINVDDPYGVRLAEELSESAKVITFGSAGSDAKWRITNVELSADGVKFRLEGRSAAFDVASNLIGDHNIHNLAGAILAVREYGLKPEEIDRALAVPIRVPGRLERIDSRMGFSIYVDYAHTDDALSHVLDILRRIASKRLIAVFGAGGDRDRSKRPRMGRAAAETADAVILTSDNPRGEEPMSIIREIASGIPEGVAYEAEPDRNRAIRRALTLAEPGDIVLVAGKGHESYQEICGVRHPFDDRKVVKTVLAELRKSSN
ncbi:MAG: UDP-N-acetylmuramoyl-L-alanyl-D-glutamate--2,6-diaminopimelate ligase [Lentisphaeria bacterium]|nr:UDP-N-acetylmuramoyl-L-alanyl-D-glutamate--2,6-diaminopimelate ligase [Lentisphaeria bacterium]